MMNLDIIIALIFGLFLLIQLFYIWGVFSFFAFNKPKPKAVKACPPVSVVICAHNELHNLQKFLPKILQQDYPNYEVIVVNDNSSDDSDIFLDQLKATHENLRIVNLSQQLNFFKGKKFPLSLGIKSAKYDHLLLTDADCYPKTNLWIKTMMENYNNNEEFVLGYGGYEKKTSLLNVLIRYETLQTAIRYFSYAIKGKPYMGVGRNLSYLKSLFYRKGGFTDQYKIMSGDDDLFVNKNAKADNTKVSYHINAHTVSPAKKSFSAWVRQKSRHLSVGKYYKKADKIRLGLFSITKVITYILFFVFLGLHPIIDLTFWAVIAGFSIFMLSNIWINEKAARKLDENMLGLWSPILDILFLLLEPIFVLASLFRKKNRW